ncbi:MAG: hypothetical protein J6R59_00545 [Paludibacteraceae bacterium]|nr:hypothetical protein [Paludibacteraceae bacterium]
MPLTTNCDMVFSHMMMKITTNKADFLGFSKKIENWQSRFSYSDENTTLLIINEL